MEKNTRLDMDEGRLDQERTHPRDNESGTGFEKDHEETIQSVRPCGEERRRTHTGGTEREEWTTENQMERRVPTRLDK